MSETLDTTEDTPTSPSPSDALHRLCLSDPVWAERYQGWEELGRGGSARVVRTFSRSAGEDVALKIFPHLSEDDVRRFQREVRNAQRLASPFVVCTFSPFLREGFAWIEMELLDGPNLRHDLERRARDGAPLSFAEALEIATCIVRAVESAHACGVIHRDVKPANVLLPRSGAPVAKLGDFGVSRVAGSTRATATGLLPGTPQFVAPEVIDGQDASAASDVYSLCLTLHLLFANGRTALGVADGATPAQWLRAQVTEPAIPIRQHEPGLPSVLEELLLQGLSKDPQARPAADEVRLVLEGLQGKRGAMPMRAVFRRKGPGLGRGPVALGIAAGVFVGVAGALLTGTQAGDPPPVSAPSANVAATTAATLVPSLNAGAGDLSPAPPAPNATPAPPLALRLSAVGVDSLSIENHGDGAVRDLRVTLVGASGTRHSATLPALGDGEDVTLGFGAFSPAPGASFRARSIELDGRTAAGTRAVTLDVGARSAARTPR